MSRKSNLSASHSFARPESVKTSASVRNYSYEHALCSAIRDRVLIWVRYKDDIAARLFEPHCVYRSTKYKYSLAGIEIENHRDLRGATRATVFEIGHLRALELTGHGFITTPKFDRFDSRYRNGIICCIDSDA